MQTPAVRSQPRLLCGHGESPRAVDRQPGRLSQAGPDSQGPQSWTAELRKEPTVGQQPWPVPESSTQFLLITPRTLDSLTEGSKLEFCQNLSLSPAVYRPGYWRLSPGY
ncbi:Hypothetical predicted protein [Marmota monax]|uniref:Uncharacterized protein n=1 Tax=Marmota monax TaxID=9995 RepID=A0A5E4A246_MARMO|nr:Hypothetical predicted protein [Marmota monax]